MIKKTVFALLISASLVLAAGDAAAGKVAYDKSCKTCHGADGTANPNIAKMMKVDIKALSSSEVQGSAPRHGRKWIGRTYQGPLPIRFRP
jgi:cytochrome c553